MAIKEYKIDIDGNEFGSTGSSPRVAIHQAMALFYGRGSSGGPNRYRHDHQLKVGETLTIKCTRLS
jgi:hypothetical protein